MRISRLTTVRVARWAKESALMLCMVLLSGCPQRGVLKVATLNLAHGRGTAPSQVGLDRRSFERNLSRVADVLRRESPDVVALQEADGPSVWSGSFDHVERLASLAGYPHWFRGEHFEAGSLRYGTALLSRTGIGSPQSHKFRARVVGSKGFVFGEIAFGGGRVFVASVHLNAVSSAIRLRQAKAVVAELDDAEVPLVVMGDFNCDWSDDSALRHIASRLTLHAFEPRGDGHLTYPSTAPRKRLDWILISEELRFVDCGDWDDTLSDHRGVWAGLAWASP